MRVQLLITCLIDSLFPEIGESVVEILTKAGAQVAFPVGQTCCGQPAMNAGMVREARQMARHTIEVFGRDPSPVILPSGSCAAMVRHGYPELFADDELWLRRARELAGRTFEFSQFIVDELLIVEFEASTSSILAYFPSCHLLRELGVDRQPKALLAAVSGPPAESLKPECCGFGGVFAVEHAEISAEMLKRSLEHLVEAGIEVVVGCDVSCLMQLEGGLRRSGSKVRCSHLAQVLAGREPGLR